MVIYKFKAEINKTELSPFAALQIRLSSHLNTRIMNIPAELFDELSKNINTSGYQKK